MKSKGYRRKSRGLRVSPRGRGKKSIRRYLQEFKGGERVSIKIDARYQSIPHPRFQGKTGKVDGKQGRAYYVELKEGKKEKKVLVNPEHLISLSQI